MKKNIFYFMAAIGLFSQMGCSQNSGTPSTCYSDNRSDKDTVLTKMINKPHFKGGNDSLNSFLSANISFEKLMPVFSPNVGKYSDTAKVKFIVGKEGSVSDLSVTLANKQTFAEEITSAIKKSSCNWVAGSNEKPVSGWLQFDIYFLAEKLNNEVKTTMTFNEFVPAD